MRYTSAGLPRHSASAVRCNSPPDRLFTSWSRMGSSLSGLSTSVLNWGCAYASAMLAHSRDRTDPSNEGEIICGLYDTVNPPRSGSGVPLGVSGLSSPARMRINVVFPVPFSPSITTIWESVNSPASMFSLNDGEPGLPESTCGRGGGGGRGGACLG